jgi:hypothetical protein
MAGSANARWRWPRPSAGTPRSSAKGRFFRIANFGCFDFAGLFAAIAGLEIALAAKSLPVPYGTGVAAVRRVCAEAALPAAAAMKEINL